MRGKGLGCALWLLLASAASAQATRWTDETIDAWVGRHLDEDGWLRVTWSMPEKGSPTIWFLSTLPTEAGPTPIVRDWIRVERPAPESVAEAPSAVMLVEVDCANRRYRTIEQYLYKEVNLRGSMLQTTSRPPPFADIQSGSVIETAFGSICKGAR